MSSTRPMSESRRVRKPLMERKRRERMNKSMSIFAIFLKSKGLVESSKAVEKLEKADILEKMVEYIFPEGEDTWQSLELQMKEESEKQRSNSNTKEQNDYENTLLKVARDSTNESSITPQDLINNSPPFGTVLTRQLKTEVFDEKINTTRMNTDLNILKSASVNALTLTRNTLNDETNEGIHFQSPSLAHTNTDPSVGKVDSDYSKDAKKCIATVEALFNKIGDVEKKPFERQVIEFLTKQFHQLLPEEHNKSNVGAASVQQDQSRVIDEVPVDLTGSTIHKTSRISTQVQSQLGPIKENNFIKQSLPLIDTKLKYQEDHVHRKQPSHSICHKDVLQAPSSNYSLPQVGKFNQSFISINPQPFSLLSRALNYSQGDSHTHTMSHTFPPQSQSVYNPNDAIKDSRLPSSSPTANDGHRVHPSSLCKQVGRLDHQTQQSTILLPDIRKLVPSSATISETSSDVSSRITATADRSFVRCSRIPPHPPAPPPNANPAAMTLDFHHKTARDLGETSGRQAFVSSNLEKRKMFYDTTGHVEDNYGNGKRGRVSDDNKQLVISSTNDEINVPRRNKYPSKTNNINLIKRSKVVKNDQLQNFNENSYLQNVHRSAKNDSLIVPYIQNNESRNNWQIGSRAAFKHDRIPFKSLGNILPTNSINISNHFQPPPPVPVNIQHDARVLHANNVAQAPMQQPKEPMWRPW